MLKRFLAALAAVSLLSIAACGGDEEDSGNVAEGQVADSAECTYTPSGSAAREVDLPPSTPTHTGQVSATIKTTAGDIPITLDADAAPCTVNSFISLAEQDFYDDTPCPRLGYSPGFAILQCGDPTGTTGGGPGYRFDDELTGNETYPAGTIAMANSGPDTNGSQFFLVFADSGFAPDYTVFGTIDQAGIDLLLKVGEKGDDGSNPYGGGAPVQEVTFTDVVID